jgi:tetratricopeptide (TPR) repeat protein
MPLAYNGRGFIYVEKEEYDKAVSDFTKAIEINPNDGIAYRGRAMAYFGKKEYNKALEDEGSAESLGVAIDPKFSEKLWDVSEKEK